MDLCLDIRYLERSVLILTKRGSTALTKNNSDIILEFALSFAIASTESMSISVIALIRSKSCKVVMGISLLRDFSTLSFGLEKAWNSGLSIIKSNRASLRRNRCK